MADNAYLLLQDGSVFGGTGFGSTPLRVNELECGTDTLKGTGEVVFNTAMSGYHEVLTDPSYTGQIVTMTYPHIGNYGDMDAWSEIGPEDEKGRSGIKAAAFAVRELYTGPVPQGRMTLHDFLAMNNTPGISGIDTRALTLKLRNEGSMNGIILAPYNMKEGLTEKERKAALEYLSGFPKMEGRDLIGCVGSEKIQRINESGSPAIALIDCGTKANIIRELTERGCAVILAPNTAEIDSVMRHKPDAVLVSNGPGDPAVLLPLIEKINTLIGRLPLFGICLGHQLISLALGASSYKMKFGHHGINHPVRDEFSKKVFVTSQNHGFCIDDKDLPEGTAVWFRNANDRTVEGICNKQLNIRTAQFHPEAAPGPRDSGWIFQRFIEQTAQSARTAVS